MNKITHYFHYYLLITISAFILTNCDCNCEQGPIGPEGLEGAKGEMGNSPTVIVPDDEANIQNAINLLPANGGSVFVRAGTYTLDEGIHINRSNITLGGEMGTLLRLASEVNQPVILIGSDSENPAVLIENIKIECFEIDGNMAAQSSETDPNRPWIRNNGIDVRAVNDLYISDVDVHHARSGGVVVSWNSKLIFIDKSSFHHNYFDGIALYASEDIQVSNFFCNDNQAAGLRLDNDLKYVMFSIGTIRNNGDVGIFARHSKELKFQDLVISKNQSHGCYLSHESMGTGSGVTHLTFSGCSFSENIGYGFWLDSPLSESSKTTVLSSIFSSNTSGHIKVVQDGDFYNSGNLYY